MSFSVELIRPEDVLDVWPLCEGYIEKACFRGPCEFEASELRDQCHRGSRNLWLVRDSGECVGAVVTTVHVVNHKKTMTWTALGGRDMNSWEHLEKSIADTARAHGVNVMRGFGRKGWKNRVPGYREVGTIIEKDLS